MCKTRVGEPFFVVNMQQYPSQTCQTIGKKKAPEGGFRSFWNHGHVVKQKNQEPNGCFQK